MAKSKNLDQSKYQRSTFTLTFAVEVVGIDVWHDCSEGWLDLGSCEQALKLQYQLYPGQNFDLQILVWPHVAKICCGSQYAWVRTWQFLERRWFTFTIHHVFAVRVLELRDHVASVTPSFGLGNVSASVKSNKHVDLFIPPLSFHERRYFGKVLEGEEPLGKFIQSLIWKIIVDFIPATYMDQIFNVPLQVTDRWHQDTILSYVEHKVLNKVQDSKEAPAPVAQTEIPKRGNKKLKDKIKKKKTDTSREKFELKLSGDAIIAGSGRISAFEETGPLPEGVGEIIVLFSSNNLPAQDDLPIVFVNVGTLHNIPVEELKKLRIEKLYTRWKLSEEEHESEVFPLISKKEICFKNHHSYPIQYDTAPGIISMFLDNPFEIQLRGLRFPAPEAKQRFFGYEKGDRDLGIIVPLKPEPYEKDIIIAVTKIDARTLAKGINAFVKGEYSLYPPSVSLVDLKREHICTNDINAIRLPVKPNLVVHPHTILEANMTLEVSLGYVGCKLPRLTSSFSRLYCLISDATIIMSVLQEVTDINDEVSLTENRNNLLTGFALDTSDIVLLYLEGPRDGLILRVWDMMGNYHPSIKPVFSSSARYSSRLFPVEPPSASLPFAILKMYVPLGALLACPAVYSRPALPLPTRSALLKIGRLVSSRLRVAPAQSEMPTASELKSFRLELCTPLRPAPALQADNSQYISGGASLQPKATHSAERIHWGSKTT